MNNNIKAKAEKWLKSNIDEGSKKEITELLKDENQSQLAEAFYQDLEFGTGGLRGIMGIGSNRINKYTVGMATQGLSNYVLQTYPGREISAVVAHDSRNNSKFFAETTAAVFSANGIKVYFFEDLRPTPELSFAIRHFKAQTGVVITASHNPKEYNGYKAYWADGGQLVPPHDKNVITEVNKISDINQIKFDRDENKIQLIGKEIDELYLNAILQLSLSPEAVKRQKNLKIVFSSIHGTGITLVPEVLKKMGFTNVNVVEEQATPDGNFPTVVYPNPEEAEALSIALKKSEAIDADLLMATDPDADRVGIAAKNQKGEFQLLNGNQTGSLLIYYVLKKWQENKKITGKEYIVKTIVTTDLMDKMAAHFGVDCYNTLTGFKYIAMIIEKLEGKKQFIAGGEESYGYLISDFVRDKDAIASCAIIAEMTAYAKDQGKTLFDMMMEMYEQFGMYKEKLISITKKGISGQEEIKQMMVNLRTNPPKSLNQSKLVKLIDYEQGKEKDFNTNVESQIDYPSSDVLQFITEDGSKISARPSGTEPKIKFYFSVNEKLDKKEDFDLVNKKLDDKIEKIIQDLGI